MDGEDQASGSMQIWQSSAYCQPGPQHQLQSQLLCVQPSSLLRHLGRPQKAPQDPGPCTHMVGSPFPHLKDLSLSLPNKSILTYTGGWEPGGAVGNQEHLKVGLDPQGLQRAMEAERHTSPV